MCNTHPALGTLQKTEYPSSSGRLVSIPVATPMDDIAPSNTRLGDNLAKTDHKDLPGA